MSRAASSAVVFLVTVLVAILGVDNRAATQETTRAQKWAVLVGVNDYGDMKKLSYCRNDAEGLRRQLITARFPNENIVLLADGAKQQRHLPFRTNIQRQLDLVLQGVDRLFNFSTPFTQKQNVKVLTRRDLRHTTLARREETNHRRPYCA